MSKWLYLLASILFEVLGTSSLKLATQQGRILTIYTLLVVLCYLASFFFLGISMRHFDLSVVYAIWSGLGVTLVALIGIFVFNDQITPLKAGSMALIVIGIVGLNYADISR